MARVITLYCPTGCHPALSVKKLWVWDELSVAHDGTPQVGTGNTSSNLADINEIIGSGSYLIGYNNNIAWASLKGSANNAMFIVNTIEMTNFTEIIVASDRFVNKLYSIRVVDDVSKVPV